MTWFDVIVHCLNSAGEKISPLVSLQARTASEARVEAIEMAKEYRDAVCIFYCDTWAREA